MDQKSRQWQLFDLKQDPKEINNVAGQHGDVVDKMKLRHKEFVDELPSLDSIPDYDGLWAKPPEGWGWEIGDGE